MITERVMPIAMFLFFILIGINGFIVVTGQLQTTDGTQLSNYIGSGNNQLGSDLNGIARGIDYNVSTDNDTGTNADAGFSIFTIAGNIWNGVTTTIGNAANNLIGVQNLNLVDNMLSGLEKYMDWYANNFSSFAGIFLAIKFFALGIKILVFGYAGSILVRAIVGRRI